MQSRAAHRVEGLHLLHLVFLVLLIRGTTTAGIAQQPSPRFFYAATSSAAVAATSTGAGAGAGDQTKVRLLRQTADESESNSGLTASVANEESSCCQGADMVESVTHQVWNLMEFGNATYDYSEVDGSGESSGRAGIPMAKGANCSPQPTIVELKPPPGSDFHYTPACTRINRCNGCCSSALISCQPTVTETVEMRVRKIGAGIKPGIIVVSVEQHVSCKCDCRIKAEDCNNTQLYRKDLCRCECQNTDARDKCLKQTDHKYWDDANCTCGCRLYQSCTTGTIFDESQCKCTDPSATATSQFVDRKRFIVQAVPVETDNSTLYSV
ncbi:uncharacterized protein LOC6644793 isoform X2 [Drosophila willistoni]|uniref:uncharacterized protein LOC6644793 isoform X2 n=1 Tax=Drosophila willistoni TaxID=7260 RepID=UPI00017D7D02|nr:uncharacterized protein LOC6644793 isoform X2 [Drosophila willistoni]